MRAGRIDLEIARLLTLARKVSDQTQRSPLLVDGKHGDAVVTAIRREEKLSVRMDSDLGWMIRAREFLRNRCDALQRLQRTQLWLV